LRIFHSSCIALLGLLALSTLSRGEQPVSIRVTVTDVTGALIPAAEVHVVGLPDLLGLPSPNGIVSFQGVPPGMYQVSARSSGFRDETVSGITVVDGKTTEVQIKLRQPLLKSSDFRAFDSFDPNTYSRRLTEIGQPLLCSGASDHESYRFLWAPTFDQPIFLRIDVNSDGTADLLTYIWRGAAGYDWGKPKKSVRKLTEPEKWKLFAALADISFWTLSTRVENPPNMVTLDGTEWLIEGSKDGNCHVVMRHSTPITSFVEKQFLVGVARVNPYHKPDR
jgi:Carboxypeptidase regulatory-like domain